MWFLYALGNQKFEGLAYLQYSLYCSSLEPNPQYLQGSYTYENSSSQWLLPCFWLWDSDGVSSCQKTWTVKSKQETTELTAGWQSFQTQTLPEKAATTETSLLLQITHSAPQWERVPFHGLSSIALIPNPQGHHKHLTLSYRDLKISFIKMEFISPTSQRKKKLEYQQFKIPK